MVCYHKLCPNRMLVANEDDTFRTTNMQSPIVDLSNTAPQLLTVKVISLPSEKTLRVGFTQHNIDFPELNAIEMKSLASDRASMRLFSQEEYLLQLPNRRRAATKFTHLQIRPQTTEHCSRMKVS